jgi:hypothetical protein
MRWPPPPGRSELSVGMYLAQRRTTRWAVAARCWVLQLCEVVVVVAGAVGEVVAVGGALM